MDTTFIRDRITSLRMEKGVSEYQMSLDLGRSRGYIQNISSGKVLPSIAGLLEICDYFEISPAQFFDESDAAPMATNEIVAALKSLSKEDLHLLAAVVDRLRN